MARTTHTSFDARKAERMAEALAAHNAEFCMQDYRTACEAAHIEITDNATDLAADFRNKRCTT